MFVSCVAKRRLNGADPGTNEQVNDLKKEAKKSLLKIQQKITGFLFEVSFLKPSVLAGRLNSRYHLVCAGSARYRREEY